MGKYEKFMDDILSGQKDNNIILQNYVISSQNPVAN